MNIVRFEAGAMLSGAACWRADGHAVGIGGGFARPGVRFRPSVADVEEPAEVILKADVEDELTTPDELESDDVESKQNTK
jgi:hypothetical protein